MNSPTFLSIIFSYPAFPNEQIQSFEQQVAQKLSDLLLRCCVHHDLSLCCLICINSSQVCWIHPRCHQHHDEPKIWALNLQLQNLRIMKLRLPLNTCLFLIMEDNYTALSADDVGTRVSVTTCFRIMAHKERSCSAVNGFSAFNLWLIMPQSRVV